MQEKVIEFSDFSFSYQNGNQASLSNISLSIHKGEFILLTGHSGCGKTTLTRCINGLIPDFFDGEVSGKGIVCGMDISSHETGDFSPHVGSVFQDPRSQFFTLHVKTEIPFPSENLGKPMLPMRRQYQKAVDALHIENLLGKSIFDLSSGEKQKVAIASIYAAGVQIYVLDEPSANLDSAGCTQLRQVLEKLKEEGSTIIISEHKLYYLNGLPDRTLIMKNGEIREEMQGRIFEQQSSRWYTRQGLRKSDLSYVEPVSQKAGRGSCTIRAENLSFGYSGRPMLWENVSFQAHGGEIVGIAGRNGAGKSTLIRTLMGLEKPKTGKIFLDGKYAPKQRRRQKSFYVMQDVDYQLFAPSVLDEMLMGTQNPEKEREKAISILRRFGLENHIKCHPTTLSGGQKQRLSIALAMMHRLPFVYLDEPTSGLDAENMLEVSLAIREMADSGSCMFVITHDYEFAAGLFTSVLLFEEGGFVEYIPSDQYTPAVLHSNLVEE